ncbi:MAG: hypothetical protein HYV07_15225 [Deltaproteobacteria bacterium]|nr:hypothetical protein [Deltaproteobacteria bacterium]
MRLAFSEQVACGSDFASNRAELRGKPLGGLRVDDFGLQRLRLGKEPNPDTPNGLNLVH